MSRRSPRPLSFAVTDLADRLAPKTTLGEVQRVWAGAVGPVIAREATPTGERGGTLMVACRSSVWAQELDLMGPELVVALNAALGVARLTGLRCSAAPPRSWVADERD